MCNAWRSGSLKNIYTTEFKNIDSWNTLEYLWIILRIL